MGENGEHKSHPKILICQDVLGNDLMTPKKKELFQSEPYCICWEMVVGSSRNLKIMANR
jgi:hypothetical protein